MWWLFHIEESCLADREVEGRVQKRSLGLLLVAKLEYHFVRSVNIYLNLVGRCDLTRLHEVTCLSLSPWSLSCTVWFVVLVGWRLTCSSSRRIWNGGCTREGEIETLIQISIELSPTCTLEIRAWVMVNWSTSRITKNRIIWLLLHECESPVKATILLADWIPWGTLLLLNN